MSLLKTICPIQNSNFLPQTFLIFCQFLLTQYVVLPFILLLGLWMFSLILPSSSPILINPICRIYTVSVHFLPYCTSHPNYHQLPPPAIETSRMASYLIPLASLHHLFSPGFTQKPEQSLESIQLNTSAPLQHTCIYEPTMAYYFN